ncbi:MAG: hypothetical protein ACPGOV_08645 [Magnetovibrionaceae bacterium]
MLIALGVSALAIALLLFAIYSKFEKAGGFLRSTAAFVLIPLGVSLLGSQVSFNVIERGEKVTAHNILLSEKMELEGALAAYEKMHADILSAKVDASSLNMFPLSNTRYILTSSPAVMTHISEEGLRAMSLTEGRLQGLVHDMIHLREQPAALLSKLDEIIVMHRAIIRGFQANLEELKS